jgi:hypothetical protein
LAISCAGLARRFDLIKAQLGSVTFGDSRSRAIDRPRLPISNDAPTLPIPSDLVTFDDVIRATSRRIAIGNHTGLTIEQTAAKSRSITYR